MKRSFNRYAFRVTGPQLRIRADGSELTYFSNRDLAWIDNFNSLEKISVACRVNALTMIQAAGSGHIGSSFSVIDPMIAVKSIDREKSKREATKSLFFTSKGHDAPGLYSVMHALKVIPDESLFTLRRLGGLPGHPEIGIAQVPTNTGSLGMGISKAKGFIYGDRLNDLKDPDVYVFLGDGELQEGQIWEGMSTAVRDSLNTLFVVVDGNKIQSDSWVATTSDLGDLQKRVESFGWGFFECEGHDFKDLRSTLLNAHAYQGPTFVYAHTLKGSGVKKFESFSADGEFYKYHSGAVSQSDYLEAINELVSLYQAPNRKSRARNYAYPKYSLDDTMIKKRTRNLIDKWAELLLEVCKRNSKIVAIDADLSYDTGTYLVKQNLPNQYLQFGIAEQDMVSTAGTIALAGGLPIVHSFASFLTLRACEQIFNNATEQTKIIYVGFLAGILPSAPGHSHQSVIDNSIMSSIPGVRVLEPACEVELSEGLKAALEHQGPTYIRVGSFELSESLNSFDSRSALQIRREGSEILFVSSGPSGTNWALSAASLLEPEIHAAVCSQMSIGEEYSENDLSYFSRFRLIVVIENHLTFLGIHSKLISLQASGKIEKIPVMRMGLTSFPANGQAEEVLRFHSLHPEDISKQVITRYNQL